MKTVRLVQIGRVPLAVLRELEAPVLAQLGVQITYSKITLAEPAYAFNKDRAQYHSNAIMRRLVAQVEGALGIMGVTDVDLFIPDAPFVFGEADREARVALLSVFRLRQGVDGEVQRRRLQIEGLHLVAHLIGLSYCEDARCVMFAATTPAEVDRKHVSLCHVCRNELAKLQR